MVVGGRTLGKILIELGFDASDFDKNVTDSSKKILGLDKSGLKMAATFAGVAGGAAIAAKELYELGARGAIVQQTGDSFDLLSEKLDLDQDLMAKLRTESRGTVDDMTLMSSTATLLAGVTDDVGKALGNATPELMKIAKAANKLNPSLGETAHMYESIATGIKRQSPLILDNLGLTIKIGKANADFAKKLGKSTDALTAEEKQLALLNATLAAGDTLIDQVGGTTEAATDSYEANAAALTNLKDTFAKTVAEGIEPFVSGLADFYAAQEPATNAYKAMREAMEEGLITEKELIKLDRLMADGLIDLDEVLRQIQVRRDYELKQLAKIDAAYGHEIRRFENFRNIVDDTIVTIDLLSEAQKRNITATVGAKDALTQLSDVLSNQHKEALVAATTGTYELERAKFAMRLQTEELTQAEIEEALNKLNSIQRMEELAIAYKDGEVKQRDYLLALMDGIVTQDEFNNLMDIGETEAYQFRDSLGAVETASGTLITAEGNTITQTGLLSGSLQTGAEKAYALEAALIRASGVYSAYFTTYIKTVDLGSFGPGKGPQGPEPPPGYVPPPPPAPPPEPPPKKGGGGYVPAHRGLDFIVPPGYPSDSFMAPLALTSGERLTVEPGGGRIKDKNGGAQVLILGGLHLHGVENKEDLLQELTRILE
jgi:hypothetical protein